MIYHRIADWDDAYTNGAYIAGDIGYHQAEVEGQSSVNNTEFNFSHDGDLAGFLHRLDV